VPAGVFPRHGAPGLIGESVGFWEFSRSLSAGPAGIRTGSASFVAEFVQLVLETPLSVLELLHFRISVVDDDNALRKPDEGSKEVGPCFAISVFTSAIC